MVLDSQTVWFMKNYLDEYFILAEKECIYENKKHDTSFLARILPLFRLLKKINTIPILINSTNKILSSIKELKNKKYIFNDIVSLLFHLVSLLKANKIKITNFWNENHELMKNYYKTEIPYKFFKNYLDATDYFPIFKDIEMINKIENEIGVKIPLMQNQNLDIGFKTVDGRIRSLFLKKANLKKIPEIFGQFTILRSLNLAGNNLSSFPRAVLNLKYLLLLNLEMNNIEDIPNDIKELSNLRRLNLSYNKIKNIPSSIAKLKNLNWLNFGNNSIENIPVEFKNLKNLKILILNNNKIKNPKNLLKMNLDDLDLINNPLNKNVIAKNDANFLIWT